MQHADGHNAHRDPLGSSPLLMPEVRAQGEQRVAVSNASTLEACGKKCYNSQKCALFVWCPSAKGCTVPGHPRHLLFTPGSNSTALVCLPESLQGQSVVTCRVARTHHLQARMTKLLDVVSSQQSICGSGYGNAHHMSGKAPGQEWLLAAARAHCGLATCLAGLSQPDRGSFAGHTTRL